nr:hypothetical transcript [Hymenolepis microstoma]
MAHNLGCNKLINWTTDFIKTSGTVTNVHLVNFNLSENARRTFMDTFIESTSNARKRTKTLICVHVRGGDVSSGALRAVPEISGERNSPFPFIFRSWSCTVALDGSVYTLGGLDTSWNIISIVERINPLNGEVTVLQPMIEERYCHSAVAQDHAILVFGGKKMQTGQILDSCEEFIPAANTWKKLPQMPTPRSSTGASHIPGVGEIVVGGRTKTQNGEWIDVDNAKIYLTNSSPLGYAGSWCKIAPMLNSRAFPSAEFLNGKVYVAGDGDHLASSVEILSEVFCFMTFYGKIYELKFNQDDENSSRQKCTWKLICELDRTDGLRLLNVNIPQ